MKRKRGRAVKKNNNAVSEPEELVSAPHSFVIHKGIPGGNIEELTRDFRKVMEPFTATSLKERKKNTIKDFVQIAGIFHVSHLCIFSRTELGVYLKICRLPRGPSLTFKVHDFSLARDVISSLKKQLVVEEAFKHSPLIVLNSFSGEGMQMKLMASMFQNMFPTINLTNVDLNNVRRCVLMNYNSATKTIDFRHYAIKVAPVGISKAVKKVVQGKVPNLARCNNIEEFLTKSGMLSESEAEDDPNSHITVPQKLISRGNVESGKSAIRLSELGPRLSMQLIKVEDGLLDGEVLYHDIIEKTEEEKLQIRKKREAKMKLKQNRKKVQEMNKKLKEVKKIENKEKSLKGMQKGEAESQEEPSNENVEVMDDDAQYYRDEVGEEPDQDLFSARSSGYKRPKTFHSFKSKKPRLDNEDRSNSFNKSGKNKFDSKNKFSGKKSFGGKNKFEGRNNSFTQGRKGNFEGDSNNKFRRDKRPGRGVDKTNSQNRDFRPIGGKGLKSGIRKFNKSGGRRK